jgi:hypothetical protein
MPWSLCLSADIHTRVSATLCLSADIHTCVSAIRRTTARPRPLPLSLSLLLLFIVHVSLDRTPRPYTPRRDPSATHTTARPLGATPDRQPCHGPSACLPTCVSAIRRTTARPRPLPWPSPAYLKHRCAGGDSDAAAATSSPRLTRLFQRGQTPPLHTPPPPHNQGPPCYGSALPHTMPRTTSSAPALGALRAKAGAAPHPGACQGRRRTSSSAACQDRRRTSSSARCQGRRRTSSSAACHGRRRTSSSAACHGRRRTSSSARCQGRRHHSSAAGHCRSSHPNRIHAPNHAMDQRVVQRLSNTGPCHGLAYKLPCGWPAVRPTALHEPTQVGRQHPCQAASMLYHATPSFYKTALHASMLEEHHETAVGRQHPRCAVWPPGVRSALASRANHDAPCSTHVHQAILHGSPDRLAILHSRPCV